MSGSAGETGKTPSQVSISDGVVHPVGSRGSAWIIYDDGGFDAWGSDVATSTISYAGNKFTENWGSFYVDMMSAWVRWRGTGSDLHFYCWTGTTGPRRCVRQHRVARGHGNVELLRCWNRYQRRGRSWFFPDFRSRERIRRAFVDGDGPSSVQRCRGSGRADRILGGVTSDTNHSGTFSCWL